MSNVHVFKHNMLSVLKYMFFFFCQLCELQTKTHVSLYGASIVLVCRPGLVDTLKHGISSCRDGISYLLSCLSPSNIKTQYHKLRSMTWKELGLGFVKLNFNIAFMLLTFLFMVLWSVLKARKKCNAKEFGN